MSTHVAPTAGPALQARPVGPGFAAEVHGVDLAKGVDDALWSAIHDAFLRWQLLVFPAQRLEADAQIAFAERFGEVQVHVMNQYHEAGHKEVYYLTNLGKDGRPSGKHPDRGTMEWHTDGSWTARTTTATMLYGVEVPRAGGETEFADMYKAYDGLAEEMKARLEGLKAVHSLDFSRSRRHGEDPMTEEQKRAAPPVVQPLVRIHPVSGRKALYVGDHCWHVADLGPDAGRPLIEELNRLAIRPDNVYRHKWRPGDLVVWDNRCLLHRALPYDVAGERRVMRRTTVLGALPA